MRRKSRIPALLASLLSFSLLFSFLGGAAAAQPASQPRQLSLDSVLSTALRQSSGAQRAILSLEERLVEALSLQHQHEAGPPPSQEMCTPPIPVGDEERVCVVMGPSDYEVGQIRELLPQQVEALRDSAVAAYRQEMAALQSDVIKAYYDALLAESSAQVQAAHETRLERHVKQARQSLEHGVISELDFAQAEVGLAQAGADTFSRREEARLALLALQDRIGLSMDQEEVLVGQVPDWTPGEYSLAAHIEAALAASAEIAGAQGQLAVVEKDLELYRQHTGTFRNRKGYRQRELAIDQARLNLADAQRQTETGVRGLHSQLAQMELSARVARLNVDLSQRLADLAKLQYEMGLATTVDVLEAEANLLQAQLGQVQILAAAHNVEAQLAVMVGDQSPIVEERLEKTIEQVGGLL